MKKRMGEVKTEEGGGGGGEVGWRLECDKTGVQ